MRIPTLLSGAVAALALSSAPAAAQGSWRVAYPEAQDPMFAMLQQSFAQQNILASMVDPLNEYFPVPRTVTVELAECGRPGAFYDEARPAVQVCYELVAALADEMMTGEEGGEELFAGAFALILLHQVGHALVDLLELPVSVSREEAADQLTAVMAGYAEGELQAVAAGAVALSALEMDWENPDSGRPALTGRRLQNLLCLLYGTDPEGHDWLVEDEELDASVAGQCEERFDEVSAEWIGMLAQHVQGG